MSVWPPPNTKTKRGGQKGRWTWWYASIADYRISHPGCSNEDIAKYLGKHRHTITDIINTDMYKEYEAQRLQAFRDRADNDLRLRLVGVATQALDSMAIQLEKKRDQVPLELAKDIAESTLDRLGFAPQRGPQVVVQNSQNVVLPNAVSPAALEEARAALRAVEQRRLVQPRLVEASSEVEAELVFEVDTEAPEALEGVAVDPTSADS
jgi:hypothetical protein